MKIPAEHQVVMPYLIMDKAEGFSDFAKQVFDASVLMESRDENGRINHSELQIGKCTIMFASSSDRWPAQTGSFFIYVPDADRAFSKALQAGAENILDLEDKDYGRSGGIKDPFGNTWWITAIR